MLTKTYRPDDQDVVDMAHDFKVMAIGFKRSMTSELRCHEPEDLAQDVMVKLLTKLHAFNGASSWRTWAIRVAKNHILSLARKTKKDVVSDMLEYVVVTDAYDPVRKSVVGEQFAVLELWLDENPREVPYGAAVLKCVIKNGGDYDRSAIDMSVATGRPWTNKMVRSVIKRVRCTGPGVELCEAINISC